MKIIRPYGRSVVQMENMLQRNILENKTGHIETVEKLLEHDDKAVLAQWVSAMDKIIAKPLSEKDLEKFIRNANKRERDSFKQRENQDRIKANNKLAIEKRKLLGQAIWKYLSDKKNTYALGESDKQEKYWEDKYTKATDISGKMRRAFPKGRWYAIFAGSVQPEAIDETKAAEITAKIVSHFYENAIALNSKDTEQKKHKGKGLLSHRIGFIKKNTLKRSAENHGKSPILLDLTAAEATMALYKYMNKGGDIAQRIRSKILAQFSEETRKEDKIKEPIYIIAVQELRQKWKEVFAANIRTIEEAKKADEASFKLHQTVKETYKTLLKGRSLFPDKLKSALPKEKKEADKAKRELIRAKLADILPHDMKELLQLIQNKSRNRDLNYLIRMGKIIHYEASKTSNDREERQNNQSDTGDSNNVHNIQERTSGIIAHWSEAAENLTQSFYWTSEGQTIIKQNEAFVRMWRRALAFAGRNVQDWIAPSDDTFEDILGGRKDLEKALEFFEIRYDSECEKCKKYTQDFDKKYNILFADEDKLVTNKETKALDTVSGKEDRKQLLEFILYSLTDLRNAAFHFKGMDKFVKQFARESWKAALKKGTETEEQAEKRQEAERKNFREKIKPFVMEYYRDAYEAYGTRLLYVMESVNFQLFLDFDRLKQFLLEIISAEAGALPLPRFQKLLERSDNAWAKIGKPLKLPPYVKAQDRMGNSDQECAKNCQYTAAYMLYDKPFRVRLENLAAEKLQDFIKKSVERTTDAAREINDGKTTDKELILARAGKLSAVRANQRVQWFFSGLMADSATEGRGQKEVYKHDADAAQDRAKYIEELKQDVVALAFEDYLKEKDLSFILHIKEIKYPDAFFPVDKLQGELVRKQGESEASKEEKEAELDTDWVRAKLYFLLHLIPVEEVSSLRQQIRKWEIVVDKPEAVIAVAAKEKAVQAAESNGEGGIVEVTQKIEQQARERRQKALTLELIQALDLYIFMHDAQYIGNEIEADTAQWAAMFFESGEADLRKVFPPQEEGKQKESANVQAFRDLREMQRFGNFILDNVYARNRIGPEKINKWRGQKEKTEGKDGFQQRQIGLHENWVKNRKNAEWQSGGKGRDEGEKYKEYKSVLEELEKYRHWTAEVRLQDHLRLHRLLMAVLGRLVDFSGLFERDLYFTLLALLYENSITDIKGLFKNDKNGKPLCPEDHGISLFSNGQILEAIGELKESYADIKKELCKFFGNIFEEKLGTSRNIRNRISHLKMLSVPDKKEREGEISFVQGVHINLTREVNYARKLMNYDRKLKNAVSKSIIKLLKKDGIELKWQIGKEKSAVSHDLSDAELRSGKAYHLKKTKSGKTGKSGIEENKVGCHYLHMAADIFAGKVKEEKCEKV